MDYIRFFLQNKRLVSFGFILTFFSSFGQTFLISLYVPKVINEFQLTNSSFGGMYAAATISSSLILVYLGKLIDTVDLRKYTIFTALGLICACLLLAVSENLAMVFVALLGLRLTGQGLLSHISNTSMSKFFDKTRGKALSIATLGFSGGEAVFPFIMSSVILWVGWRYSLTFSAGLILCVLIPFVWFALSKFEQPKELVVNSSTEIKFSRLSLFKEVDFYILAANVIVVPFLMTGLLFYQTQIAASKGWTIEWITFSFTGYAIARTIVTIVSGRFIDKYTAVKLLPFHLIPFIIGVTTILLFDFKYEAFIFFIMAGSTMGLNTTLKAAAMAEIYDIKFLGGIKSVFVTFTVLGTALCPLLFGVILDSGHNFSTIFYVAGAMLAFVTLISLKFFSLSAAIKQKS